MSAPEHPRSAADVAATVVLGALAALAGVGSVVISPFFVMTTDACGPDNCRYGFLTAAYAVTWGAVVLAALVAVIGVVRAVRRHRTLWHWTAAALALVVAGFALGVLLAMLVMPR